MKGTLKIDGVEVEIEISLKDVETLQKLQQEVKKEAKSWEDLEDVTGFYITDDSIITSWSGCSASRHNINNFRYQSQAQAALAIARLTQLLEYYNEGWFPDWGNEKETKYYIYLNYDAELDFFQGSCSLPHFLTFKDEETRSLFMSNTKNMELVEEYFQLFKKPSNE